MTALRIVSAGPGITLQDAGRAGYLRYGVTGAGPMDRLAFATANHALGNPKGAPAIEVSLGGVEIAAEGGPVSVAVAGGAFQIQLDGRPMPPAAAFALAEGGRLAIRAGKEGAWCYVAVAAELDVTPALGSVSTHTRSGLGGLGGRALAAGDTLTLLKARLPVADPVALNAPWLQRDGAVIRVLPGPQDDYFGAAGEAVFYGSEWTVGARSDRMAYFAEGPAVPHAKGFNIVSDGIALGAIQVPGEGKPLLLMGDRQPTGGYPKIANVIGVDVGRLAQLRPGTRFRFEKVDHAAAVAARRAEAALLDAPIATEPVIRSDLTSEFLYARNLVGGVVDGFDPV